MVWSYVPRKKVIPIEEGDTSFQQFDCRSCESGGLALVEDHWRLHDWPDLEMFLRGGAGTGHTITDVSITCPGAPSHRRTGASILGCANARSDSKRHRYEHLSQASGAANLPAVFESIGGIATHTRTLIRRLVQSYAVSPGDLTPGAFSVLIHQALSVCLQRGNALVDLAGLRHAARHSRHSHRPRPIFSRGVNRQPPVILPRTLSVAVA